MSMNKRDKERQLQELTMIVTGIRLFNKECGKGGEGIDDCKYSRLQIIVQIIEPMITSAYILELSVLYILRYIAMTVLRYVVMTVISRSCLSLTIYCYGSYILEALLIF